MNKLFAFIRTTLVGGVLYLIPIVLLLVVVEKALTVARKAAPAFANVIAAARLGNILTPGVFAALLIVTFCFLAGLFSRTRIARRIAAFVDEKILINLPGYGLMRSVMGSDAESLTSEPVLACIGDEAWQIAFVVDRLEEDTVALYVPGAPDTRSGSLYFVAADRTRPLQSTSAAAMHTLRRMGFGSRELLKRGSG